MSYIFSAGAVLYSVLIKIASLAVRLGPRRNGFNDDQLTQHSPFKIQIAQSINEL